MSETRISNKGIERKRIVVEEVSSQPSYETSPYPSATAENDESPPYSEAGPVAQAVLTNPKTSDRLTYKFALTRLKNEYPGVTIIIPPDNAEIAEFQTSHSMALSEIAIAKKYSKYKMYLALFIGTVEVLAVKNLGSEIKGFLQSEMNKPEYDRVLIDLSRKYSETAEGEEESPESALFTLLLYGTVGQLIAKYINTMTGDNTGDSLVDLLKNGLNANAVISPPSRNRAQAPRATPEQKSSTGVDIITTLTGLASSAGSTEGLMGLIGPAFKLFSSSSSNQSKPAQESKCDSAQAQDFTKVWKTK
jgi:hypothetical protein